MSRLVLDASAAIAAVLGTSRARGVLDALENATSVIAPDIYAAETANTLWKYVRAKEIDSEEALTARSNAMALVDEIVLTTTLGGEPLAEAIRYGHPVDDLCYAVVARRTSAAVLTHDARLGRLLQRMGIERAK